MRYLVKVTGGPGFSSPDEGLKVLESLILPTFDALLKLEKDRKILAAGLPVGAREFVMIVEADSNEALDAMLRAIPAWALFDFAVTPLQTIKGRTKIERDAVAAMKK